MLRRGCVFGVALGDPGGSGYTCFGPFRKPCSIKNRKSGPKVAQTEPKMFEKGHPKLYAKIDAEKGAKSIAKGFQNDANIDAKIIIVQLKIDEQINVKIYAEKVMNIYGNSMRKWYGILSAKLYFFIFQN